MSSEFLIHVSIEGAFERNREPVESLYHADRAAGVHVDRQPGEAGLQVGTTRIVGRDEIAVLQHNLRIAQYVDAAVGPRVEIRRVERGNEAATVLGVGALDADIERMAFPIGVNLQFRGLDKVGGRRIAGSTFGVLTVSR